MSVPMLWPNLLSRSSSGHETSGLVLFAKILLSRPFSTAYWIKEIARNIIGRLLTEISTNNCFQRQKLSVIAMTTENE